MSKQRPRPPSRSEQEERKPEPQKAERKESTRRRPQTAGPGWSRGVRLGASLLIALHVTAVFVAPWGNQTDPQSLPPDYARRQRQPGAELGDPAELRPREPPLDEDFRPPPLIAGMMKFFRPYLNATYTNHGYDFFTPDPSGSFLIGYQAFDQQGNELANAQFPKLGAQWPRLFYHRHMMLAAQMGEFGPDWWRLICRRLLTKHHADRVVLYLVYHRLPLPEEVAAGIELNASWLYETQDQFELTAAAANGDASADRRRDVEGVRIPGVAP
ncbi:hypothetical protein OAS39_07015 [Pirellulales bacterium]|nr:hypothetical protein [Pirellulales bacterium]